MTTTLVQVPRFPLDKTPKKWKAWKEAAHTQLRHTPEKDRPVWGSVQSGGMICIGLTREWLYNREVRRNDLIGVAKAAAYELLTECGVKLNAELVYMVFPFDEGWNESHIMYLTI